MPSNTPSHPADVDIWLQSVERYVLENSNITSLPHNIEFQQTKETGEPSQYID